MRVVALSLLAIALTAIGTASAATNADLIAQFDKFKMDYKRSYANPSEEAMRLGYFIRNMQTAAALQALNPHAKFGANEFSDLSEEEFKPMHNAEGNFRAATHARRQRSKNGKPTMLELKESTSMAQQVDWRQKGAVTPPKNQGLKCGSCWSFSTTGNIEGQWAIAGNGLVSLSEQELVSCNPTCNACHGGLPDLAFEWIINARGGGITSEAQYPYVSGLGNVPSCDMTGKTPVAFIDAYKDIAHSENAMAQAVAARGPVSIGVDGSSFQSYQGGILTNCQAVQVDHAVLIVGYDLTSSPPYWIIKNSWGTSWGEEGFIRVEYGQNECLITTAPSISEVAANPPPVPPTGPPAPPAPPAPAGSTFTQMTCTDSGCSVGCQKNTIPTGVCVGMSGGGSVIVTCGELNLHLQVFTSTDCTGSYNTTSQPLNQCVQDTTGSYVENQCSGSSSGSGSASHSAASSSGGGDSLIIKPRKEQPLGEARLAHLKSKKSGNGNKQELRSTRH